jgi:DNA-binding transcriptional MerR regulator
MEKSLPAIPAKRYFTIGEVSELCGVKAYVLRYWEQEFSQLRPVKRRGNRRYYQHHEVLLVRRIRDLLYDKGFTISGARNQLAEWVPALLPSIGVGAGGGRMAAVAATVEGHTAAARAEVGLPERLDTADEAFASRDDVIGSLRAELLSIRRLLDV